MNDVLCFVAEYTGTLENSAPTETMNCCFAATSEATIYSDIERVLLKVSDKVHGDSTTRLASYFRDTVNTGKPISRRRNAAFLPCRGLYLNMRMNLVGLLVSIGRPH
jgi:hypothetical protein